MAVYRTTSEGREGLRRAFQIGASRGFAPPPRLTVSQWADEFRFLSSRDSAEPGKWCTARAEYQRGIMDAFSDPEIERIAVIAAAQTGKTQGLILNSLGFVIDQDPGPILVVQATRDDAEEFSKDRFTEGLITVTPVLRGKIRDDKRKGQQETLVHKTFPGGQLTIAWSNSPSRLSSRPIRYVFLDEIDKYNVHPKQGDPIERAIKRTSTYWNRKIAMVSTPTLRGMSPIESAYERSDRRRFHVPCPECGELGVIGFFPEDAYPDGGGFHIAWPKDPDGTHHPELAYAVCHRCGAAIEAHKRDEMVMHGTWIAENPGGNTAGFHLPEMYSPWVSWAETAERFLKVKENVAELRTFYNEHLARTWEEKGEAEVKESALMERVEEYPAPVPAGACMLTAAVDVQPDRLEVGVHGWGPGEESWAIDYRKFFGDSSKVVGIPGSPTVWEQLDQYLDTRFEHESGLRLSISCTLIDSAGHNTKAVYQFCKTRRLRRIFASIGRGNTPGQVRPIISNPTKLKNGCLLFTIGVDTVKESLYRRLLIEVPGPQYCHFPKKEATPPQYDAEYFRQLTAEKLVSEMRDFRPHNVWKKIRARNEALDVFVYAMAALELTGTDLDKAKAQLEATAERVKLQVSLPPGGPPLATAITPVRSRRMRSKGISL